MKKILFLSLLSILFFIFSVQLALSAGLGLYVGSSLYNPDSNSWSNPPFLSGATAITTWKLFLIYTTSTQISSFDGVNVKLLANLNILGTPTSLTTDSSDNIYLSTTSGYIYKSSDGINWNELTHLTSSISQIDYSDALYIYSSGNAYKFQNDILTNLYHPSATPEEIIAFGNTIYFSTSYYNPARGGIFKYEGGGWADVTNNGVIGGDVFPLSMNVYNDELVSGSCYGTWYWCGSHRCSGIWLGELRSAKGIRQIGSDLDFGGDAKPMWIGNIGTDLYTYITPCTHGGGTTPKIGMYKYDGSSWTFLGNIGPSGNVPNTNIVSYKLAHTCGECGLCQQDSSCISDDPVGDDNCWFCQISLDNQPSSAKSALGTPQDKGTLLPDDTGKIPKFDPKSNKPISGYACLKCENGKRVPNLAMDGKDCEFFKKNEWKPGKCYKGSCEPGDCFDEASISKSKSITIDGDPSNNIDKLIKLGNDVKTESNYDDFQACKFPADWSTDRCTAKKNGVNCKTYKPNADIKTVVVPKGDPNEKKCEGSISGSISASSGNSYSEAAAQKALMEDLLVKIEKESQKLKCEDGCSKKKESSIKKISVTKLLVYNVATADVDYTISCTGVTNVKQYEITASIKADKFCQND